MRHVGLLSAVAMLFLAAVVVGQTSKSQPAQSQPGDLEFLVHWSKGDLFRLEVSKKRTQTGKPEGQGRTQVDLEVLQTGEDGHVVTWTIRKSEILDANGLPVKVPDSIASLVMEVFNDIPMEVELSSECVVTGIRNFSKLRPALDKTMDAIIGLAAKTEADKADLKAGMEKLMSSEQFTLQAFTKELSLYLQISGGAVPLEGVLEGEDELPMPIGGGVVASKVRVKLESLDKPGRIATVTGDRRLDPEAAAQALTKLAKEITAALGKPGPGEFPKIDVKDEFRYVIDLKTGLPNSMDFKRTTTLEQAQRVETYQITLKSFTPASRPAKEPLR